MSDMNVVDLQRSISTSTPPTFSGGDGFIVLRGITSFTGTGDTDLPSVDTTNITIGDNTPYFIRLSGQFVAVYLESGAADVSDPGQVSPLDNPSAHWTRGN